MEHVRQRVLSPEEEAPAAGFYAVRHGKDARVPLNNTALRRAERKYKRKDYADLVDFARPLDDGRIRQVGAYKGHPVYEVDGYEGFRYIPGALDEEEQVYWATRAIADYFNPPNPSSIDAIYDFEEGFSGFWQHIDSGRALQAVKKRNMEPIEKLTLLKADIEALVRKLRWTTLGYRYNWTTKTYNFDPANIVPFPPDLAKWSVQFASGAGYDGFKAEAGIVNYYQVGDSLTSHVDRSELNMQAPLLSMSLGLAAVFVLGGVSRESSVIGIRVRSGDVSIMSGPSRLSFHGVPRIIEGSLPQHLKTADGPLRLIQDARININIRQVT